MSNKLTLSVDRAVAEKAKRYARRQGRSLSNLVQDYLKSLVETTGDAEAFSPLVKSLLGAVKVKNPAEFDEKKVLEEALTQKYLNG